MKYPFAVLTFVFACLLPPAAATEKPSGLDWNGWRKLPVQNAGRHNRSIPCAARPCATWAIIPGLPTGDGRGPGAPGPVPDMLFDWQGWDHAQKDRLLALDDWHPQYFRLHTPDKWDQAPLLLVGNLGTPNLAGPGQGPEPCIGGLPEPGPRRRAPLRQEGRLSHWASSSSSWRRRGTA